MDVIYNEEIPCEILDISHQFRTDIAGKKSDYTHVKIKPKDKNNFYLFIKNIDEKTENSFLHAYKNNKKMIFSYQLSYVVGDDNKEENDE